MCSFRVSGLVRDLPNAYAGQLVCPVLHKLDVCNARAGWQETSASLRGQPDQVWPNKHPSVSRLTGGQINMNGDRVPSPPFSQPNGHRRAYPHVVACFLDPWPNLSVADR
jgi:hypothetical protein